VFDQLSLKDPAIVGHSFGGMVAAEVAATNPERCRKLVLLNPIGLWRDDAPVQNWMVMLPDQLAKVAFADPEGPIAQAMLAPPQDEAAAVEAAIQMTWSMACTGKFVWPIPDKGLKKRLHRITAETLIIWGEKDGLVPPVYAEEFRNRIKNSRVETLANSGHMPQLEQAAETAKLVQDFLK
jgi:pimeloyl-ACP methyl ester carboxylesterase